MKRPQGLPVVQTHNFAARVGSDTHSLLGAQLLSGSKANLHERKQSHQVYNNTLMDMSTRHSGSNAMLLANSSSAMLQTMSPTSHRQMPKSLMSPNESRQSLLHGANSMTRFPRMGSVEQLVDTRNRNARNDPLSIIGALNPGWGNETTNARNAHAMRNVNTLNLNDVVNNVLKKPVFGFEGYKPKAVVRDLIPSEAHKIMKSKRRMFAEEA